MNQRESNIELLRLLCMFFIIIHHIICHALPLSEVYMHSVGLEFVIPQIIDAFCICAVPVFVLISGWFGIKPKLRGFLNLYVQCAFYFGLLYLVHLYLSGGHINRWCLYNTIFPFSFNPDLWFIECYVILYLLSPLLNGIVTSLDKKSFGLGLVLLTIVICYFGFYRQSELVGVDGFSPWNFAYLYLVGRYLSLHVDWSRIDNLRLKSAGVYIVGSFILGLLPIVNKFYFHFSEQKPIFLFWEYNHPLLIVNSIALLMLFTTLHFNSRVINWASASTLCIYLLHDNIYLRGYWTEYIVRLYPSHSPCWSLYLIWIGFAILVMALCICVDQLRKVICTPIVRVLDKSIKGLIFKLSEMKK